MNKNKNKTLTFLLLSPLLNANVVGGIYTVLKSKAPVTCHEYGDRYTMIGPLSYKTAPLEVETLEPDTPELRLTLESMKERGVKFLYGRWLIEGAPKVLLFDTGSVYHKLDEWKGDLWNVAGIPSPPNDHETNEAILFGYLVAWFLGEVRLPFSCFIVILRTKGFILSSVYSSIHRDPNALPSLYASIA